MCEWQVFKLTACPFKYTANLVQGRSQCRGEQGTLCFIHNLMHKEVYFSVGQVLENAPNPFWASGRFSGLITVYVKKIKYPILMNNHSYQETKYPVLIYDHSYQNPNALFWYITVVLSFLKKTNNCPKKLPVLSFKSTVLWGFENTWFWFFFKYLERMVLQFWQEPEVLWLWVCFPLLKCRLWWWCLVINLHLLIMRQIRTFHFMTNNFSRHAFYFP